MWYNGIVIGVGFYAFTRSMIPKNHHYAVDIILVLCKLHILGMSVLDTLTSITAYPFETGFLQRDTLFVVPTLAQYVLLAGAAYSTLYYGSYQTILVYSHFISIALCHAFYQARSSMPLHLFNMLGAFEVVNLILLLLPRENMILKTILFAFVRVILLYVSLSSIRAGLFILSFTMVCQCQLLYQIASCIDFNKYFPT